MAHSSFSTSGCFLRRVGAFRYGEGFARPACSAKAISWSMSSSWPPQALSTRASQRRGFISFGSSFMDEREPRLRGDSDATCGRSCDRHDGVEAVRSQEDFFSPS